MHQAQHRNRLAGETSPYLLQHAGNPVHWQPWDEAALAQARATGKPILLSIGYSACHWCHVMAHESFEDPATAEVMNQLFINIKVDREERPDLDRIYQIAHQMLTQRGGGWPLTMFLSPHDLRPFFGGTYFPREARHGLPAFADLLRKVHEFHSEQGEALARQGEALQQAFDQLHTEPAAAGTQLTPAPIEAARQHLAQVFDSQFGGFGGAPKFPHPTNIELLMRLWRASANSDEPDLHCLYMATLTLKRMAEGGLYDQLGGGFSRYSVDSYWMIPHFEKMLYDNGQLLRLYADAALATGETLFRCITSETAHWVMREMQSEAGGYYSALDADSEGEEGRFYVWTPQQVQALLSPDEFAVFSRRFGLDQEANFEHDYWHLHVYRSEQDIANELGLELKQVEHHLEHARRALLDAREQRVRPGRDEKILTAWNALMISGMAAAGRAMQVPQFTDSACRAVDFLRQHCWREGRLLATCTAGQPRFAAYLDDYAFLLDALLELLQARWRDADLSFAVELADGLLEHFQDEQHGGFFFTAHDHEQLLHRSRTFSDEALPAGNAIAAKALHRLGLLLGETRYLDAAERTLFAAWPALQHYPHAHAALLLALHEQLQPPQMVIIRGAQTEVTQWRAELSQLYSPSRLVFAIAEDAQLPPALASKQPGSDTLAYICEGTTCSAPVKSLASLISLTRA